MPDRDLAHGLSRLLAATARAHHDVPAGPDHDWARWYAERVAGDIDEFVGFSPTVDEIREWLVVSDETHRATAPDDRWPPFYAQYILKEYAKN